MATLKFGAVLCDGAIAIGIFNVGEKDQQVDMQALITPLMEGDVGGLTIRDLWRQKDLTPSELNCIIHLHGCKYLKVRF